MGEVALLCSWLRANKTFGRKRRRGKPGCCSTDNQCFGCVCAGVASQLAVSTRVCGQFAPCVRALLAYTLSREEAHACTTADSNNFARARVSCWAAGGCAGSHHRQVTAILLHLLLFCHGQADSPRTFYHTQSRAMECRGNLAALGASRKASRKITSVQTSMKTPRNTRILVAANATKGGGWCGTRHRAIAACYLSVPASNRTGDKTLILLMNHAHACLFVHRLRHPHGVERSQRRQDGAADPH